MASTSSHDQTSLSILARVRRNESAAWSELVDLYAPLVASWCRHRGLKSEDAADVVQNVFFAVARGMSSYVHRGDREGSFRGWLWAITRNKIRDWARAKKPDLGEGGSSAAERLLEEAIDTTDDEPTDNVQLQSLLQRALAQVQPTFESRTWQAFWRTVVDGQSTDVVAEQLGMNAASIRQARSRVLRRLREQLGDAE